MFYIQSQCIYWNGAFKGTVNGNEAVESERKDCLRGHYNIT